jgi:uncharacterized membrane protein YGL010W
LLSENTLDHWLAEYSLSHRHPANRIIHTVCVPAILFASIALLWNVHLLGLRAAYLAMVLVAPFYLALGWRASIIMAGQFLLCVLILSVWPRAVPLLPSVAGIFGAAWIGQFVGHAIEGRRPKFLQDVMFLLIGPLWVVLKHR